MRLRGSIIQAIRELNKEQWNDVKGLDFKGLSWYLSSGIKLKLYLLPLVPKVEKGVEGWKCIIPLETSYIVYQLIKGLPSVKSIYEIAAYDNLGCWEFWQKILISIKKFCKMKQLQCIYWLPSFSVHNVFTRFKTQVKFQPRLLKTHPNLP